MTLRPAIAVCLVAVSLFSLHGRRAPAADEIAEKVLAEDGIWGYNGPHAVYRGGKLFFNYIGTEGIVWAASYGTQTGEIERGKVWETYGDLHPKSFIGCSFSLPTCVATAATPAPTSMATIST